jgi:xanthine dehydrogenase accessory factor
LGWHKDRVLRAPTAGLIESLVPIGMRVEEGQAVARVGGTPIIAPFAGVLRGLIHDGQHVADGMKVGDLDPRAEPAYSFTISDKALAVGGGVLEAILSSPAIQAQLR